MKLKSRCAQTARQPRPRGVILYEGPSRINGAPIVVIATFNTANAKTGNMIQTWILCRDLNPIQAINAGADSSICGSCPLRGVIRYVAIHAGKAGKRRVNRGRGCYVSVKNAPRAVWRAFKRGRYPYYHAGQHAGLFAGRKLRLGAYGDPVAVPLPVWKPLLRIADGWTGYTHQWSESRFKLWRRFVMASTHSLNENREAQARGWRTFRTVHAGASLDETEVLCPASAEGSYRRTCETCQGCNGSLTGADGIVLLRRSFAIVVHGSPAVLAGVNRVTN